jgi:hypothetical protein
MTTAVTDLQNDRPLNASIPSKYCGITVSRAAPKSWDCIDCGMNTAPGMMGREDMEIAMNRHLVDRGVKVEINNRSEVYQVKSKLWKAAGSPEGCLCIGCLETRLGRTLNRTDFDPNHAFNQNQIPGTERLMSRRNGKPGGLKFR